MKPTLFIPFLLLAATCPVPATASGQPGPERTFPESAAH